MTKVLQDVLKTAKRAVDTFHGRLAGALDFSERSLQMVEEMLAEASDYINEMPQSEISSLVQLFGCYVLEVARTTYGGEYAWLDDDRGPVLIVGEPATHIAIASWAKVRGRVSGDAADNIPFFYRGFADMASALPVGKRILFV